MSYDQASSALAAPNTKPVGSALMQDLAGALTCLAGSVAFGIVTAATRPGVPPTRLLILAGPLLVVVMLVVVAARRAFRDVEQLPTSTTHQVEAVGRTMRREVLAVAGWLLILAVGSAVLGRPELGLVFASAGTVGGLASVVMLRRWESRHTGRLVRLQQPLWRGWRLPSRELRVVAASPTSE